MRVAAVYENTPTKRILHLCWKGKRKRNCRVRLTFTTSSIPLLPDCIAYIYTFLGANDVLQCRLVNRVWNKVASRESTWLARIPRPPIDVPLYRWYIHQTLYGVDVADIETLRCLSGYFSKTKSQGPALFRRIAATVHPDYVKREDFTINVGYLNYTFTFRYATATGRIMSLLQTFKLSLKE